MNEERQGLRKKKSNKKKKREQRLLQFCCFGTSVGKCDPTTPPAVLRENSQGFCMVGSGDDDFCVSEAVSNLQVHERKLSRLRFPAYIQAHTSASGKTDFVTWHERQK